MGWISDVANNGVNAEAAQNWVNQKKEEEWAAAKEEERRKDRVNASEGVSYDPAPKEVINNAKESFKAQAEKLKETVTGGTEGTGKGSGTDTAGTVTKPVTYEPTPAPEPEPTPTPAPAAAGAAAELRAEQQRPVVYSDEKAPEQVNAENGRVTTRSKGEPVVYTGGTTGTIGMKRSSAQTIAAQTKNEITEEDDDATILQKYWAMSPEEQAEQVGNKRVQAALRAQANQQAAGSRGNGYLPTNPLYSEGFSTRGEYNPRATQYSFNGQQREVGVENNRPYDRPLYPAATNDQRAAEYLAGWQRRNASIQQANAMQNYQYDPLQAAILRANAGLGGSGLETRGYDPGLRLANDPQYLADNGFSWAGNPSMQSEDRGGTYEPPTPEGQEDYDTQVRILKDRGYSQEDAERMAAEEFGPYTYSGDQPSYVRRDVPKGTAEPADVRQGYYQEGYREAMAQNMSEADAMRYAENYATEKTNALQKAGQMTDAERARRNPNASYYYAPIPGTGTGSNTYAGPAADTPAESGTQTPAMTEAQRRFEQEEAAGLRNTEVPGGNERIPGTETYQPAPGRPGAEAAAEDIMNGNGTSWVPDSVRFAREAAERRNAGTGSGSGTGTGAGTAAGGTATKAGSGTGSGSGTDVPEKSQYFRPSYGQDMKVGVKAPYRKGGYSEEELRKMGNASRTDRKYNEGKPVFEGYYLAPDGQYYPIDQIKANYYVSHGNSYRGWDEDMREYWKNFGTFFGYRPDWRTAGGKNVWKQNRPSTRRSYGGGGGSASAQVSYAGGGNNYGRGSTANNGIYWNGNTSWSI